MLSKKAVKKTGAAETVSSQGLDLPAVQDNQRCSGSDLEKVCLRTGSQPSDNKQINESSAPKLT